MLVYLDESYAKKEHLMLGALFFPSRTSRKWIHKSFLKLKRDNGLINKSGEVTEIKYNKITTRRRLDIAKKAIDLFFCCQDSYFRAVVVPYSEEELDKVRKQKGIPRKIKEAMLYTHETIRLLKINIPNVVGATLLMDRLTRARQDRFDELILDRLGSGNSAMFDHIGYVDSCDVRTHLVQICDLLLGVVLNENYPTKITYKNDFREYVKKKLGVKTLKESYWGGMSNKESVNKHPKYTVRYWGVPYQDLN